MVSSKSSVDLIGAYTGALARIRAKLRAGQLHYGDVVDLNEIMPDLNQDEQDRICAEQLSVYQGAADPSTGIRHKYNFNWLPQQRRLVIYTPAVPRPSPS